MDGGRELATRTVIATLKLLGCVPPGELYDDNLGDVLYMLARVLEYPEVLT